MPDKEKPVGFPTPLHEELWRACTERDEQRRLASERFEELVWLRRELEAAAKVRGIFAWIAALLPVSRKRYRLLQLKLRETERRLYGAEYKLYVVHLKEKWGLELDEPNKRIIVHSAMTWQEIYNVVMDEWDTPMMMDADIPLLCVRPGEFKPINGWTIENMKEQ